MDKKWTNEFPTKPGWYWFYGHPWGKSEHDMIRLTMMRVIQDNQGEIICTMNNSFIYKSRCQGMFYKVTPPELPS